MAETSTRPRCATLFLAASAALAGCGSVNRQPGDDGGTPPVDADTSGGGDGSVVDGAVGPDARPLPTEPPVENGQSAILVLGQPNFMEGATGLAANRFAWAGGIAAGDGKMWIADIRNARVLQWNTEPVANEEPADLVIGQTDFVTAAVGPTNVLLTPFEGLAEGVADVSLAGDKLVVADGHSNRVLVWNQLPAANGEPADMVLGQDTFTGATAGVNADQLNAPSGVWSDGDTLIVVDLLNNRALIWSPFPSENGQPADVVLGQESFTSSAAPDPPTASSMNQPTDVVFDGERLYIVDSQNHRIMGWNGIPAQNNAPADFFVGQPDGESNTANAGAGPQNPSAAGLASPFTIEVAFGSLFVTDRINFRAVVYSPRPASTGDEADAVLGWLDLDGAGEVPKGQGFTPRGIGVYGDRLYLSDSNSAFGTSRVLSYQLSNLP